MTTTIHVPATSANLGPGFDILAVALDLENVVTAQPAAGPRIVVDGTDYEPDPSRHLLAAAYVAACTQAGVARDRIGVDLRTVESIPRARGFGSSAATTLAGVLLAQELHALSWSHDDVLDCVASFEGHCDNAAAALLGGLTVWAPETSPTRVDIPDDLRAVLFVPDLELRTAEARALVPATFSRATAIFNAARCALFVRAIVTRDYASLGTAMEDRWHQEPRTALMPWLPDVIAAARRAGAYGAALSGAGPSVIALTSPDTDAIATAVAEAGRACNVQARTMTLALSNSGARIDAS